MMGFDHDDSRLIAKGVVVVAAAGSVVLAVAGVLGLAWRVFSIAAGG